MSVDDAEPRPAADDGRDRPPTNLAATYPLWDDAGATSSGVAAWRFAGELERLMAGLAARGIAPAGDTAATTAPVDTALAAVDRLREQAVDSDQLRGRMRDGVVRTEIRVERGTKVFTWEGDLPLIPEGQVVSFPGVAATAIVASIIFVSRDGSVMQRLAGR